MRELAKKRISVPSKSARHIAPNVIQFLLVQADFLADGARVIRHDKTLLSQYNGHFSAVF